MMGFRQYFSSSSGTHASIFSYNLTKPYPFRWFTPLTVIGGVVAAVLFSVLNFASNGYEFHTVYTTDPNSTISAHHWFNQAPWSWGTRHASTCQTRDIPLGTQIFTSNFGLAYTLTAVSRQDDVWNQTINFPSLPYLNQTLEDCQVDSIVLFMRKLDLTLNGASTLWSWDDSYATAQASCRLQSPDGPLNASFTTTYRTALDSYDYALRTNATTSASTWWGTRLLNLYWGSSEYGIGVMMYGLDNGTQLADPFWTRGTVTLKPNRTVDIKADDFLALSHSFVASNGDIFNDNPGLENLLQMSTHSGYFSFLSQAMSWAKVMFSLVMVDFGQTSFPNVLLQDNLLQWISQHPDDAFRNTAPLNCTQQSCDPEGGFYKWTNMLAPPSVSESQAKVDDNLRNTPMNESYDTFHNATGPLGTQNATIFSQYACSVPVKKATGTLVITILIADLVFLQVCWNILTVVAQQIVERRHDSQPEAYEGLGANKSIPHNPETESMVYLHDLPENDGRRLASQREQGLESNEFLIRKPDVRTRETVVA